MSVTGALIIVAVAFVIVVVVYADHNPIFKTIIGTTIPVYAMMSQKYLL